MQLVKPRGFTFSGPAQGLSTLFRVWLTGTVICGVRCAMENLVAVDVAKQFFRNAARFSVTFRERKNAFAA